MEKVFIILIGLAWGSFLNVVIYRLPAGMSLIRPSSSCPRCRSPIKPYDNIPVFSYLLLRGRCRSCGGRISPVYPLVEILTALSFFLLSLRFPLSLHFVAACLFSSGLIVLGMIDFFHQIIPDEITLPGLALALIYSLFRPDLSLRQALVGAASGALFLLFIYGAYFFLRKKEGLGMGDVTMMLFVGAFLGWRQAFFTLILASFSGALVGAFLLLWKKKDLQYALPFGTFLAPAAYIALLWGEPIVRTYLDLYKG